MKTKKWIALLFTIVLFATIAYARPSAVAAEPHLGDVNHDDIISPADARSVLRVSVGLDYYDETFFVYADVNKNNLIDVADARLVLRAAVGLEDITCTTTIEDIITAGSQKELNRHAFRVAISEGYSGTMEEWLDSLQGKDGLSAYEIAVKLGFKGSEQEWLDSLKGKPGKDGEDGKTPYIGSNGNWWIDSTDTGIKAAGTNGVNGTDGKDGTDGEDGADGENGVTPHIGSNGNWWIGDNDTGIKAAGTDGANGTDGKDGVSVVDSYVDENYHLWIVLSDGNKIDAGYVGVQIPSDPTEPDEPSTDESATEEPDTQPPVVNGSTVTVDSATVNKGQQNVRIALNMNNNPGILGMTLELTYNEDIMTLVGIEKGTALSEMTFTVPKNLNSGCNLPWDAEEVLPEDATNGEMLVLLFNVSSTAPAGDYIVSLTYDNGAVIDNDLMSVDLAIVNGIITVK